MVKTPSPARIAIIGGGYAGLSCAVELARAGVHVSVFERGRVLGGRARVVFHEGHSLDNGQHILIGGYTETARMLRQVGVSPKTLERRPLTLDIPGHLRLVAARLPAPFHLAVGLLRARGLDWTDRRAMLRLMRHLKRTNFAVAPEMTVLELLHSTQQTPRLNELVWIPLCVAALNTPVNAASAQVFVNVLRDSLAADAGASELLIPRTDLTELFPVQAARWLATRRGRVDTGRTIKTLTREPDGFALNGDSQRYDQVVIATAPYHAGALLRPLGCESLADRIDALQHEPITTVYFAFSEDVELPETMIGLTDGPAQWAFDRGALNGDHGQIACVISAHGPHEALSQEALHNAVHKQLSQHLSRTLPKPLWVLTITERRATIACTPGIYRPGPKTPVDGLWLAGDYLDSPYPATIESAVRSGCAAAQAALHHTTDRNGIPV